MKWSVPDYSKSAVNRAGKALLKPLKDDIEAFIGALDVLSNWRSSHALPLNAIQMNLRNVANRVCDRALVAQRLKRTPSIIAKLRRIRGMQLARMQDIGGCRAVVANVSHVKQMHGHFLRSRTRNELVGRKDYISQPKSSGYRGVHLVYRYCSSKYTEHNGLMVEIQVRSKLQHIWATGVETVGAFIKSPLKSSIGPEEWLQFFSLLGSAFAQQEKSPPVPGTPESKADLIDALATIERRVTAIDRLEHFGTIVQHLGAKRNPEHKLFLVFLQPVKGFTEVTGYRRDQALQASEDYLDLEKKANPEKGEDVVLVLCHT